MNYSIHLFKADACPELGAEYCRRHAAALAEYGCGGVASSKQVWMENPNAYALVVYDELGEMVSGIRLHFHHDSHPLPMETALKDLDARIVDVVKSETSRMTGEICGLWAHSSIRSKGFGPIMCQTATALAHRLGAASLFSLVSPHTHDMMLSFGYLPVPEVGRAGDFLYPTADYISTVMVMPDLARLEHTAPVYKEHMLSIRRAPRQIRREGRDKKMQVSYQLDRFINQAPAPSRKVVASMA